MTTTKVSNEDSLQSAKTLTNMWVNVYVKPLRDIPLEARLIDGKVYVKALAYLNPNQELLLDEYRKEISAWYNYFLAQHP